MWDFHEVDGIVEGVIGVDIGIVPFQFADEEADHADDETAGNDKDESDDDSAIGGGSVLLWKGGKDIDGCSAVLWAWGGFGIVVDCVLHVLELFY